MDESQRFLKKISCTTKRSLVLPCLIVLVITVSKMCFSTLDRTIVPIFKHSESVGNVHDGLFKLTAGSRIISYEPFSDKRQKVDCKKVKNSNYLNKDAKLTRDLRERVFKMTPFKHKLSNSRTDDSLSIAVQPQTESSTTSSVDEQFQSYIGDNVKDTISPKRVLKLNMNRKPSLSFIERRALMEGTLPYTPDEVDLMALEALPYEKSYKNPCWLDNSRSHNYTESFYTTRRDIRQELRIMTEIFHKRQQIGDYHRVRCLPYFLIIGQPKSGSTDLYRKIIAHPEVRHIPADLKEPHWWARTRLGRHSARGHVVSLDSYVDLFDHASYQIEMDTTLDETGHVFHHLVTGEGSMSTFWDNDHWWAMIGNKNLTEPRILIPDYIRHLLPDIKLILILRNPTTRMYSDFLYFRKDRKSPGDFHEAVVHAVRLYQDCFQNETVRSCVYNYFLNFKAQIRLRVGLYSVFLEDWLRLFPRQQIFIIRTEDYANNPRAILRDLFNFMELRKLTPDQEDMISSLKRANTRRKVDLKYGDMLPQTKAILDTFYKPFNEELTEILNDNLFLWEDELS